MKLCRQCKTECSNEVKFCQECGYRFTEDDKPVKVCKNCNTHNSDTSKFCSECGTPFEYAPVIKEDVTLDDKSTSTEGESVASNTPKMTVDLVTENDYVVSSSDEENDSQAVTDEMAQVVEESETVVKDAVVTTEENVIDINIPDEKLIDPDPDLREPTSSVPTFYNQGEVSEDTPVLDEVDVPIKDDFQSGKDVIEVPTTEEQPSEPETYQTETELDKTSSSDTNNFNFSEIITNDPYYDDIPLADNGATKVPMDKEKKKEIALIIGSALFLIALITVFLMATA